MIDYSEGYLLLQSLVKELYSACLKQNYAEARALCDQIVVNARMTRAQLSLQEKEHSK